MAFRPDEQVVRGEIDNRVKGRVVGKIWFTGRAEPIELSLTGNAARDLAGRRLEFVNPKPVAGDVGSLARQQTGTIGDCTASRKVRVPDISIEEFEGYQQAGKPFPWHWGNSLYLEWFGDTNGRVVIESASYRLTVTDGPTWEMSDAEEAAQQAANADAVRRFMEQLTGGIEVGEAEEDLSFAEDDDTDEDLGPLTEAEAESLDAENEKLIDRIEARIEREGHGDLGRLFDEELERRRIERGEEPLTPEEEARRDQRSEELARAGEDALAGEDPETEAVLRQKHPLAARAFEQVVRLHREVEARGWLPDGTEPEHPVLEWLNAMGRAGAKLAGALNGQEWPPAVELCAHNLVRLKRASGYLDDALRAAADCGEQQLVDAAWLAVQQQEMTELRDGCEALIAELRAKLDRGCD